MNLEQVLALILFIAMFILIVMDKIERHYVTMACGVLTIIGVFGIAMRSTEAILETLNIKSIFTVGFWYAAGSAEESTAGINWATIIFIAGMMVMVEAWQLPAFSAGCA